MNTYVLVTRPDGISPKAYIMISASSANMVASHLEGRLSYEIYKGTETMLLNGINKDTLRDDMKLPLLHSVKGSYLSKISYAELQEDLHVESTAQQYNAEAERSMANSQNQSDV